MGAELVRGRGRSPLSTYQTPQLAIRGGYPSYAPTGTHRSSLNDFYQPDTMCSYNGGRVSERKGEIMGAELVTGRGR